jgi:hypothetical protein
MLLLALALSLAEEFLIQQSSLAPMMIRLKGVTYARAFGINYVYLLWALLYETVFVVFLPVYLTEMLFPGQREEGWLSRKGMWLVAALFLGGAYLAWYSWTRIARPQVFHVPAYHPSAVCLAAALVLIAALVFLGLRKRPHAVNPGHFTPPPAVLAGAGGLWAVLLEGLVILAFGLDPAFPPVVALLCGAILAGAPLFWMPRWTSAVQWSRRHLFFLLSGTLAGLMAGGYAAYVGSLARDLHFKIIANGAAVILLGCYFLAHRKELGAEAAA